MIKIIKNEVWLNINKKGFKISFLILFMYAMGVSMYFAITQMDSYTAYLYNPAIVSGLNADNGFSWYFCRLYPFIVVLPAGFSIFNDRNSGIINVKIARIGKNKYYLCKMISSFITGWIAFSIPFYMEFLLNMIIFPHDASLAITNWPAYSSVYIDQAKRYLLSDIFFENPYIYIIIYISLIGVFSGCVSVFVSCVGIFNINNKIWMFLPFYLIMYAFNILSKLFGNNKINLDYYITVYDAVGGKSLKVFCAYMVLLILIASVFLMINRKKEQVY